MTTPPSGSARDRAIAVGAQALAHHVNDRQPDDGDTVPATWAGLVSILDRHYPPEVFTGATGDQGPRVVTLVRAVAGLRGQVAAVRALAEDAMKLPTLDDPRPASDFISPRAGLAALEGSGEAPADTARTAEESRLRAEVAALEAFSGPSTVEGERWVAEQYRRALARALGIDPDADPGLSMVSLIQAVAARTAAPAGTPAAPEAANEDDDEGHGRRVDVGGGT